MAKQVFKLSATGRAMLTLAASRQDRLTRPPQLPIAARQVVRSMLNNGLVEEVPDSSSDPAGVWRTGEDGKMLVLRATAQGMAAIGEAASESVDLMGSSVTFIQLVSERGQQTLVNEDLAQTLVDDQQAANEPAHAKTAP